MIVRTARAILILLSILLIAGCSTGKNAVDTSQGGDYRFVEAQPQGEVIAKDERKTAPDIKGKLLDGSSFDLTSYKGKVLVLNFWASWCAPCRVEAPDLESIYQSYQSKGVDVVGVLVRDDKQQGQIYAKQIGLTYPSVFDPDTEIALQFKNYPPAAIPSTTVIDTSGKVAAVYVAAVDKSDLLKTLNKLLAEK
ncbi:MAG: TlpA disulfide reductase family protein [Antricoccus sp.]